MKKYKLDPRKRYYAFSKYLQEEFNSPIYKIAVDAGFSCPNRDGRKAFDGCTFCNNEAFSPAVLRCKNSLKHQILDGISRLQGRKKKAKQFIVYFQPFSNTYAEPEVLRKVYQEALEVEGIVGIAVGTRADCINDGVIEVLKEFSEKTHFWLELGLETTHDETLKRVKRGHDYQEFLEAYNKLKKIPSILLCIHLIHGLPGESFEMMLDTIKTVNELKPDAVKFHQLEIVTDTILAEEYKRGEINLLSKDEYLDILGKSLKILDPKIVVQRLFGFTPTEYLIAPIFEEKTSFQQIIEKYLEDNNIWQGDSYVQENCKV